MAFTTPHDSVDAEEHTEFFGPTPEASETDWGLVPTLSPSSLASSTGSARQGESQVSSPGNRKNRPGKICREVRDLQESIQHLSQDIECKANSTAVKEALDSKVDIQEFQEAVEKLNQKADISQLENLETVITKTISDDVYQSPNEFAVGGVAVTHRQSFNAQQLNRSSLGHEMQSVVKGMAIALAGASFCLSGFAIGRCSKQQKQIEQLRSNVSQSQQDYEKLKNKHVMVAVNGLIDFDYVVSLEDQLKADIHELGKALLSKAGQDRLLKLNLRFKENAEELIEILKSGNHQATRWSDLYVDKELRQDVQHLGEILQGAAKYSEDAVPTELEEHVQKLNRTLLEGNRFDIPKYPHNIRSKYPHINAQARAARSRL